jgi:hypothetical protein
VEIGGSGTEERRRFWACRMPRCSLSCRTVTKREELDDELDCTGADRARRNPGCLRVRLTKGVPVASAEVLAGRLDIRYQTTTMKCRNLPEPA